MTGDLLKCNVLATHTIANVSETLARKLELPERYRSIGILTADSDDVTYCALDEATKAAAVEVVYGRSLYAGAANANTKLAGEVIGILAGPNPAEVSSGLRAAVEFMDSGVGFRSANEDDSIVYFAHTVSRTGTYLSKTSGVREGEALAYLIAPPLEAVVGLDEAMKAADVELVALFFHPARPTSAAGSSPGPRAPARPPARRLPRRSKRWRPGPAKYEKGDGAFGQGSALHPGGPGPAQAGPGGPAHPGRYDTGAIRQNNSGRLHRRRRTGPKAGRHGGGGDRLRHQGGQGAQKPLRRPHPL